MNRRAAGLGAALVISAVATIEAVRLGHAGLAVLTGATVVLVAIALVPAARPSVHLRGDLWRWVDQLSASTGETPDDLVDRAVSAYRSRLTEGGDADAG